MYQAEFTEPYDHFIVEGFFEDPLYDEMMERLPDFSEYRQYNEKYKNRYLYDMHDPFWSDIALGFHEMFGNNIRVQMCRDLPGYFIGPHTDGMKETCTMLFYLTDKEIEGAGTCVYVPVDPEFRCNGRTHHGFEGFKKVKQVPYKPNYGFGFYRSDNSFHGVEPTNVIRNIIQVSIWHDIQYPESRVVFGQDTRIKEQ